MLLCTRNISVIKFVRTPVLDFVVCCNVVRMFYSGALQHGQPHFTLLQQPAPFLELALGPGPLSSCNSIASTHGPGQALCQDSSICKETWPWLCSLPRFTNLPVIVCRVNRATWLCLDNLARIWQYKFKVSHPPTLFSFT